MSKTAKTLKNNQTKGADNQVKDFDTGKMKSDPKGRQKRTRSNRTDLMVDDDQTGSKVKCSKKEVVKRCIDFGNEKVTMGLSKKDVVGTKDKNCEKQKNNNATNVTQNLRSKGVIGGEKN